MKNIKIPKSNSGELLNMEVEKNIIIVGANGSGKTRLGSRIEHTNNPSKRISAQRHLVLSPVVQKQDFETSQTQLRQVYNNKSPISPQNDYQQVLVSLFAEESERNKKFVNDYKKSSKKDDVLLATSVKEQLINIWNFVFPHRALKLENDRVNALNENTEFSGSEMSDGERVGLYLVGQVLLADKGCILIIDEPELHLHKSLMVRLWNKLEEQRKDCTFIYITHDLDFAVSRPANKIIWVQSFKNNQWNWDELNPNKVIPENLYLEVLGSRKPILFVEGDKGSLDIQVYQSFYESFTVIPVSSGSSEKVIESVKGLRNNTNLHNKEVFGLIDRDFRLENQIGALKKCGIFCLEVNKVENLFLVPEIIEIVCNHLCLSDKKEEIALEIKAIYSGEKDFIKFRAAKYRIQNIINEKFNSIKDDSGYQLFKQSIFEDADKHLNIDLPSEKGDLLDILKIYPYKGLVNQIQKKVNLTNNGYQNLILGLFSSDKRVDLLNILEKHLPKIILQSDTIA